MTYLEADVVADQDVPLHEVPLVLPVLSDHGEGVVDGGAQDADQRLDPGVGVHIGEVGLHDVTGSQPWKDEGNIESMNTHPDGGNTQGEFIKGNIGPVKLMMY